MRQKYLVLFVLIFSQLFLFGCQSQPAGEESMQPPATASGEATGDNLIGTSATGMQTPTPTPTPTPTQTPTPTPEPVCMANLTALTMDKSQNPTLADSLSFVVSESDRTATLTVTYQAYADLPSLQSAVLKATAENGTAKITGSLKENGSVDLTQEAFCIVTDEAGVEKSYALVLKRQFYQIPIVNLTLPKGKKVSSIQRDTTMEMTFSLDCSGAPGFESLAPVTGTIRGRGNSTWQWEKKPYKIKLDEKASLLGLDDNRDWILLANYVDKSLIRNTLAYEMGRMLRFSWTPTQYPVDLFINGVYQGVYSLGEHMEVAKGRVNIKESDRVDTGYLIELGGTAETGAVQGVDYFHTKKRLVKFAAFVSPSVEDITEEQKAFIIDYFQKAENAIIAGEGYEEYIDVDSFVDWILMHELSNNIDSCFRRSCYLTKEKGEKLKMGPIWDFDLAFGNFSKDNSAYDTWVTIGSEEEGSYVWPNWCTYLVQDPEFRQLLANRWKEISGPLLQRANAVIDQYGALLDGSQQENFRVWNIWDTRVGYQSRWCSAANSYDKQLQYLKDFLQKRANFLDKQLL